MKQRWQQLVTRIDALNLRERVFLFLAIIVCSLALVDTFWLSPAQMAYTQAKQRVTAQEAELQRLRAELAGAAQQVDPAKAVRDEIADIAARLEAVNVDIRAVAPLAEGGPAIEQTLVQFLRRREGLTLVRTGTVKQDATPAPQAGTAANGGGAPMLSRRGLELTVTGPYAELVRYVSTLENALPTLRWGSLQLKAAKEQPPELTLQVFVVGAPL
jgi:MSHA biogenesis protein MshJ